MKIVTFPTFVGDAKLVPKLKLKPGGSCVFAKGNKYAALHAMSHLRKVERVYLRQKKPVSILPTGFGIRALFSQGADFI
ncbi:hypothetical protein AYI88_18755 [Shewanella algae]|nr:hypothetical protein AYI88_18755 [Shewanella algae]